MARRDRIMRGYLRHRIVITMKNGATWDGVLYDQDNQTISLRDVTAIQADHTKVPADGDILLARCDIDYCQWAPARQT